MRAKLSTFGFGGPTEVTCGGNALKFYASMRLHIRRTGLVKKGEEVCITIDFVNVLACNIRKDGFQVLIRFYEGRESRYNK